VSDAKVLRLDDLERRVFWYSLIVMLGLAMAAIASSLLISATNKSLSQVNELSDRAERLAPAASVSEPPKT
jgi:hypothetical protein